ncbi:MAG: hypothetical protein LBH14_07680 [Desulfobulbaceae bacterium]|jgi:uncharacterized HAD superfamily protein|nr:hypothetical protein [Desulfobulbaceae bacterium]
MKIAVHEIGFDFDGVIADTAGAFLRLACQEYEYCSFTLEDVTRFEVSECLNIPDQYINAIFHTLNQDCLGIGLEPMPGAVEVLSRIARLTSKQCPVRVITARRLSEPVAVWLAHHFPADVLPMIHLTAMGEHGDKLRHIKEYGLKFFVDDRAETCLGLAEAGISPLVFKQPWNRHRHQLPMVADWRQIGRLIRG